MIEATLFMMFCSALFAQASPPDNGTIALIVAVTAGIAQVGVMIDGWLRNRRKESLEASEYKGGQASALVAALQARVQALEARETEREKAHREELAYLRGEVEEARDDYRKAREEHEECERLRHELNHKLRTVNHKLQDLEARQKTTERKVEEERRDEGGVN